MVRRLEVWGLRAPDQAHLWGLDGEEVKVTFTCEKCGHVVNEMTIDPQRADMANTFGTVTIPMIASCPVCNPPQLSYGPITEEMVAEMLRLVDACETAHCYPQKDYNSQARAVLRLLQLATPFVAAYGSGSDWGSVRGNWRDKLLELAEE
jgi:hypothetical protein